MGSHSSRILSLDLGEKRIGVAVSDETHTFSFPLTSVEVNAKQSWLDELGDLIEENGVGTLLVGLPLDQAGEVGEKANEIRKMAAKIQKRYPLPIIEWDERFTTAQAERTLLLADSSRKKRKKVVDKLAATILLQSYLDSTGNTLLSNDNRIE